MPLSILIVRLSSLGDIILTEPVVGAVRAAHSDANITFAVKQEYREIVERIDGLDDIIALDTKNKIQYKEQAKAIRATPYDWILDLHNTTRSRLLTLGLKNVRRVNKRTLRRRLLVMTKVDLLKDTPDVIGKYFEAAKVLGVEDTGAAPKLSHIPVDIAHKRVALCPGSKHWNKRWPIEYFIETGRALAGEGYAIEVHGSNAEKEICSAVAQAIPNAIELSGTLGLGQAIDRLAGCSLAVTNDSGLMHVASAVGIPVVSIFGPTVRPFGFMPRAENAIVLENEGLYCRPCTTIGLPHCPEKHFRCMREITPNITLTQIRALESIN